MGRPGPILVVDDDPEVREVLEGALDQDGYEVVCASGAAAGLAYLETRPVPVVITDLQMPGLSGLDFMSEIQARFPETHCVVITGFASTETAIEALKRGAYDFLQKPFKIGQIEATISRALDHALTKTHLEAYQHRLEDLVLARTAELRALHEEVLRLNTLLIEALGEADLNRALQPFLAHLRERHHPDEDAVLCQGGTEWRVAAQGGPRTWDLKELQARLARIKGPMHLTAGFGSLAEGFLIPLRRGDRLLGVVVLGFHERSAFHPGAPAFDLWCRQVEAVLHGWARMQARG